MDSHVPDVTIFHCFGQGLGGKILGTLAGVKDTAAQIYSVGAVLYGSPQGFH
jgi:hypothetical protein